MNRDMVFSGNPGLDVTMAPSGGTEHPNQWWPPQQRDPQIPTLAQVTANTLEIHMTSWQQEPSTGANNTDPGCSRAMDPDMAPSCSPGPDVTVTPDVARAT